MIDFGTKLGRCHRCMILTGLGLGFSVVAVMAVPERVDPMVRTAVYGLAAAFGLLAAMHLGAVLYRTLNNLNDSVRDAARGCCRRSRRH